MWWNCASFARGWVSCSNRTLYDWLQLILRSLDSMLAYHNSQRWRRSEITWQTYEDSDDDAQRINMRTLRRMRSVVAWWWSWTTEIGAVEQFWFRRKLLSNGALRTWWRDFAWKAAMGLDSLWCLYSTHFVYERKWISDAKRCREAGDDRDGRGRGLSSLPMPSTDWMFLSHDFFAPDFKRHVDAFQLELQVQTKEIDRNLKNTILLKRPERMRFIQKIM